MSYPIEKCNVGELLTDGGFDVGNGAWTVGDNWSIPGDGEAVFSGISAVETMIWQNITIVKEHALEVRLRVLSVNFIFPPRGFHVKIGGATTPLITAAGDYVWYLLPTADGVQPFQITADDPPYELPDSIFLSYVSCKDVICEIANPDLHLNQPDLRYYAWPASSDRIMVKFVSKFDNTKLHVIHEPGWP